MIPAEFTYHAPRSLDEAVRLLAATPDAKVLGGGMSLIPAMKLRLVAPPVLVDVARVPGLDGMRRENGAVRVGGGVTHDRLAASEELRDVHAIGEAAGAIGDVQVRNRGTIGGSLVHADPAADWPAVFLAFDGEATLRGPRGERRVAAKDFFTGILQSAAAPDEILTEVRFALPGARSGTSYVKMRHPASGFAVVGVAACVTLDEHGRCAAAAVGVTGVNATAFRAAGVEKALVGTALAEADVARACGTIPEADPLGDAFASAEYRRHLLGVWARRAILAAHARARGAR
ncbi:MAG TPA: xanthine dehydrogenase family protein subunit M [Candidatus Binatia bacterium]|jgi:carbon-monoxide dehydrogenase medium subunit|nr:xanthine dehydrogenase family protein subunit M [Candidatus Binatia bacterium]